MRGLFLYYVVVLPIIYSKVLSTNVTATFVPEKFALIWVVRLNISLMQETATDDFSSII